MPTPRYKLNGSGTSRINEVKLPAISRPVSMPLVKIIDENCTPVNEFAKRLHKAGHRGVSRRRLRVTLRELEALDIVERC